MAKNDDILQQAGKRFKEALAADRENREKLDEDVRFAINDDEAQWPSEIRQQRQNAVPARPCLSINKIPEKIDQVEGEFKQMQPSVKVRAVDSKADPIVADVIAGLIRHIEYDSDARTAYNTAHTSVLYGGRGAWRHDIVDDETDPFVKSIKINRIPNILSVVFDPLAKKLEKSDMNYCFVTELLSKDEYKAKYGEEISEWPDEEYWNDWKVEDRVRIGEYWWKEKTEKTFYRVQRLQNGIPATITVDKLDLGEQPQEEKKVKTTKVRWCKMAAGRILEGPHDWPTKDIPIFIEPGKETNVRGQNKTRGMVRFAKTSQMLYNYWTSAQTETVALAPKVPYLVTGAMIGPYQPMWDRAHEENRTYLLFDVDQASPNLTPRREPPPVMSSAYAAEMTRHDHDIMSSMGIYQASLGDRGDEKSGRAIIARQKQGNIGSYAFIDNFRATYTHSIRALIDLIPKVYDTERIVRILGEDDETTSVPINARPTMPGVPQEVPPNLMGGPREGITNYLNDITVGKYDVAVTMGPSYTTLREESLVQLLELVKSIPQVGAASLDLIVELMDMPGGKKLAKRLKKLVPPDIRGLEPGEQPPPPPPPDPKMIEIMQNFQIQMREQMRKEFETQVNAIKTVAQAEALERGQQFDEYKSMVDHILQTMEIKQQAEQAKAAQAQGPVQ